jgi:hypothetical protein
LIPYNSTGDFFSEGSGNIINGGDYLPLTMKLGVIIEGSGTVTTDTSGTISIEVSPATQIPATGYYFIGQEAIITAPDASNEEPLEIVFIINKGWQNKCAN